MSKLHRALILVLIFSILTFSSGCSGEGFDSEIIPTLVEKVVDDTEKAISTRDVNLARETWSKVTEYSVKAQELDNEKISKSLSCLTSTYVKLIEYCETGDENLLNAFNAEFTKALEKFKEMMDNIEETQA